MKRKACGVFRSIGLPPDPKVGFPLDRPLAGHSVLLFPPGMGVYANQTCWHPGAKRVSGSMFEFFRLKTPPPLPISIHRCTSRFFPHPFLMFRWTGPLSPPHSTPFGTLSSVDDCLCTKHRQSVPYSRPQVGTQTFLWHSYLT